MIKGVIFFVVLMVSSASCSASQDVIDGYYNNCELKLVSEGHDTAYYIVEDSICNYSSFNFDKSIDGMKYVRREHTNSLLYSVGYKNGKKEGVEKVFFEDGTQMLSSYSVYKEGKIDGIDIEYYWNGNVKMVSFFKMGSLESFTYYNLSGEYERSR
jgi:antitoxin component YwqK of YwqJK toxin-antitoxin module